MQEERNGITLTILQEKGGCGKSCAIFNIADYLSKKKNVLIIDLDGQAADISYFLFSYISVFGYFRVGHLPPLPALNMLEVCVYGKVLKTVI